MSISANYGSVNIYGYWNYTVPNAPTTQDIQIRVLDTAGYTTGVHFALQAVSSPAATNDAYTVPQAQQLSGNVLQNDTSGSGAPLTARLVASTQHGALTLSSNGTFSYLSDLGFYGSDTFRYVANDGTDSNQATVTVTVTDRSVVAAGGFTVTANAGQDSGLQTAATFQDPAGALSLGHYSATIQWGDGSNSPGVTTYDAAADIFTVQGSHTYAQDSLSQPGGLYPVDVTVSHDGAAPVTIRSGASVTAIFAVPVITDAQLSSPAIDEGDAVTISGHSTDASPADAHTVTVAWGDRSDDTTLSLPVGVYDFTTPVHRYGDDGNYTVTVVVSNGTATSEPVSRQLTVGNVAPTVTADNASVTVDEGQTATNSGTFADAGNDPVRRYLRGWQHAGRECDERGAFGGKPGADAGFPGRRRRGSRHGKLRRPRIAGYARRGDLLG